MKRQFGPTLARITEALGETIYRQPALAHDLGPLAGLIGLIAADVDGHVAERLAQAERIKDLLRRAAQLLSSPRAKSLEATLVIKPAAPQDFHIDAIETYIEQLSHALGDAQRWLEGTATPGAAALLRDILAAMETDVRRVSRNVPKLW